MKEKYDIIGKNYNQTRKADAYLVERIFYHLSPIKSGKYLDIGCGTGNYTIALSEKGIDFIGVEPSEKMLAKAKARNSEIEWKFGKAEEIPLKNESVEGILATLTIHHWTDLRQAFRELNRVLKSEGKIVIFTTTPEQNEGYWLNYYFPEMLKAGCEQLPDFETVEDALNEGGFEIIETEKYFVREDVEDAFLFAGKYHPEFYLDEKNRQGISSFADLANSEEVENGLKKLERDIISGKINEIIADYENDLGDYLFVIAQKVQ